MVLSIILIVIVALVAYFHYLQGFFSSALSAVLTILAAITAVAYHETVVALLLKGQFADQANAIALVVVFAVTYTLLRLAFDKLVPGNVQFPLYMEKLGAGVMGFVAGLFTAGVFALAAQSLPFGPSMAGLERYPFESGSVTMIVGRRPEDVTFEKLDSKAFLENQGSGLLVAADSMLLGLVEHVSDPEGSLSNGNPLGQVHPDYLQELFGQRVGLQSGSKRAALAESVSFLGAFRLSEARQDDNERWESERDGKGIGIRHKSVQPSPEPLEAVFKPAPEHVGLVVRLQLGRASADTKSGLVSFTPAAVRLAHNRKNHFPIGTLQDGKVLFRNEIDDVLFVPGDRAVDLVFEVPESVLRGGGESGAATIVPGVLVEFKRLARIDLSGKQVEASPSPDASVEVLRKKGQPAGSAKPPATPAPANPPKSGETQSGPQTATPAPTPPPQKPAPVVMAPADLPMTLKGEMVPDRPLLPSPLNVGTSEEHVRNGEAPWGKFTLVDRRFTRLEVDPVQTVTLMSKGEHTVDALWVAAGSRKMWSGTFIPSGSNKWAWVDALDQYELNAGGGRAKANGVYVLLQNERGQRMALARFDTNKPVSGISAVPNAEPLEVNLYYVIALQAQVDSMNFRQQPIWKRE